MTREDLTGRRITLAMLSVQPIIYQLVFLLGAEQSSKKKAPVNKERKIEKNPMTSEEKT